MTLAAVRAARDYIAREFKSDYPFAQHQFATDGKSLLRKAREEAEAAGEGAIWQNMNRKGQFEWDAIIAPCLKTFEYEMDLAIRWHVAGEKSQVIIDPRIAFGSPSVGGLPTALLKDRWAAGDDTRDMAADFGIPVARVREALQFEGVDLNAPQPAPWIH